MLKIYKITLGEDLSMAKPKIFISSTFYDLKHVRNDLDKFIKDIGYDTIRNETGSIPYNKDISPEEGCYKEIENADIVVSIIGGRFGSISNDKEMSVCQRELKKAITDEKQVFIFIDKAVYAEYKIYDKNKDQRDIIEKLRFNAADNFKIFEHIEALEKLDKNNAITTFDSSNEIIGYLKEQFAGLFQRFLQQQKKIKEVSLIDQLSDTATSLQRMVDYFSTVNEKVNESHSETVTELLLSNHPAMNAIKKLLGLKIRVFFLSRNELSNFLELFSFQIQYLVDETDGTHHEYWMRIGKNGITHIKISDILFDDDGKLKPMRQEEWKEEYIKKWLDKIPEEHPDSDDVPF